jgi:hypothetical protein
VKAELAFEASQGVGVNEPINDMTRAVICAAGYGSMESVKLLLETGADVSLSELNEDGHLNALFAAVRTYDHPDKDLTGTQLLERFMGILDVVYYLRTETEIDVTQHRLGVNIWDFVAEDVWGFYQWFVPCEPLVQALMQLLLVPGMFAMGLKLDDFHCPIDSAGYHRPSLVEFVYCKPVDFDITKARSELKAWFGVSSNVRDINLGFRRYANYSSDRRTTGNPLYCRDYENHFEKSARHDREWDAYQKESSRPSDSIFHDYEFLLL